MVACYFPHCQNTFLNHLLGELGEVRTSKICYLYSCLSSAGVSPGWQLGLGDSRDYLENKTQDLALRLQRVDKILLAVQTAMLNPQPSAL